MAESTSDLHIRIQTHAAQALASLQRVANHLAEIGTQAAESGAKAGEALSEVGASAEKSAEEAGLAEKAVERDELKVSESIDRVKESIDITGAAMKGMAVLATGGMLEELSGSAEKTAIQLDQLKVTTGQTATQTEQLAIEASGAGVGLDQLNSMVGRMDMRLGRAMSGSSSLSKALSALGISAQAFSNSSLPQQAQMIESALYAAHLPAKTLASTLKTFGVNAQDFANANAAGQLQQLQHGLQTVVNSGQSVGRMLQDAGINASQFMQLPFPQQLADIAKGFHETKNRAQATALVMTVFGRSGAQMIPLIEHYKELNDYASKLHMPVMNTEEITLASMKTKMLMTAMQMMADSVLVRVLPIIDHLGRAFYDLTDAFHHPIAAIKGYVSELGIAGAAIITFLGVLKAMKIVMAVAENLRTVGVATLALGKAMGLLAIETAETGEKIVKFVAIENAQAAATKIARGAQLAFNAVMAVNPIVLVTLAIVALVAGIYELVKHWKSVEAFLRTTWHAFSTWAAKIWRDMTKGIQDAARSIYNAVAAPFNAIQRFISHMASEAVHWGENLIGNLVKGILGSVGKVAQSVGKVAKSIANFLGFHSPAEEGPGADADQWAPNFIAMYTQGLERGLPQVHRALARVLAVPTAGQSTTLTTQNSVASLPGVSSAGRSATAPVIYLTVNVASNAQDNQALANEVATTIMRTLSRNGQLAL